VTATRPRATALAAALLLLGACGGENADPGGAGEAPPVETTTERGPISMTVRAEPGEITVGGKLRLTVDVTAPEGVEVRMPRLEDAVGAFAVRDARTPPDVPEGEQRRFTHTYELDTFASGEVEIPALTVGFIDRRPQREGSGEAVEGELASEPLAITVASVLAGGERETDFRDIKSTVEVPVEKTAAGWLAVALPVLIVAAAAIAVAAMLSRKRRKVAQRIVPPHEWALGELDRLEAKRLIEQARFHELYFALSDIVRQYIERRFGIMAPERTTEEFLRETRGSPLLGDDHRDLLGRFLRAADMVKFARHEPSADEAQRAFAAARGFVKETTPEAAGPMEAAA
jgi:hypothetical protein